MTESLPQYDPQHSFRLIEFDDAKYIAPLRINNSSDSDSNSNNACGGNGECGDDIDAVRPSDWAYTMEMFGVNKMGETASILVRGFIPFFFVEIPMHWTKSHLRDFRKHIEFMLGPYYANTIVDIKKLSRKRLYGFDAELLHTFAMIRFKNENARNRARNLWFQKTENWRDRNLLPDGYKFGADRLYIYEANLPAMLRLFHMADISPTGWVAMPPHTRIYDSRARARHRNRIDSESDSESSDLEAESIESINYDFQPRTTCTYEYEVTYTDLIPLNNLNDVVPYKEASMDIEAGSSHGDFPVPIKTYSKLASEIVDAILLLQSTNSKLNVTANAPPTSEFISTVAHLMRRAILVAFDAEEAQPGDPYISRVFPKYQVLDIHDTIREWMSSKAAPLSESDPNSKVGVGVGVGVGVNPKTTQACAWAARDIESAFKCAFGERVKTKTNQDGAGPHKGGGGESDNDNDGEDKDNDEDDENESESESDDVHGGKVNPIDHNDFVDPIHTRLTPGQYNVTCPKTIPECDSIAQFILYIPARSDQISILIDSLHQYFPPLEGDPVTFIGTVFRRYGEAETYLKHCIVLNTCDPVEGAVIESYATEREVLIAWARLIQRENPDFVMGYNVSGFDYPFMFSRAKECDCLEEFLQLSRRRGEICAVRDYKTKEYVLPATTTRVASGEYTISDLPMTGRVRIDMHNWFRRTDASQESYALDAISGVYIGDRILRVIHNKTGADSGADTGTTDLVTRNVAGLNEGNYIQIFVVGHSRSIYVSQQNEDQHKFQVLAVVKQGAEYHIRIQGIESPSGKSLAWGFAKDDVGYQEVFRLTRAGSAERAIVAKYCIQDCALVSELFKKVDVVTDLTEMGRLCSVPMRYLITRGQGVKLHSFLAKQCRQMGYLMPMVPKGTNNEAYEGAIVLDPKEDLYTDKKVPVGDFASLYPSSIQSDNLCVSSKVWTQSFDLTGVQIGETGERDPQDPSKFRYDHLPDYEYVTLTFNTYKWVFNPVRPAQKPKRMQTGSRTCCFASKRNGELAVIPAILKELIEARKRTRKLIPNEPDEFMKAILNARQLSYKTVANSTYGLLAASTSACYDLDVAAATTAVGRMCLLYAKAVLEECYTNTIVMTTQGAMRVTAEYVYGDTDSVFFTLYIYDAETGIKKEGAELLALTIEVAVKACKLVSKFLKEPHEFEYEKTYGPLCLLSRKRYVGIKYEFDVNKGVYSVMGVMLKRRDNAPIAKDIYGGVMDILLSTCNIHDAIDFMDGKLRQLVAGEVPLKKLTISKSLRSSSSYAKPMQIAHNVLAMRMGERDAGTRPRPGERVPFVFIVYTGPPPEKGKRILQGYRIESPAYLVDHPEIKLDYNHYITNQIMTPLLQLFALVLDRVMAPDAYNAHLDEIKKVRIDPKYPTPEKQERRITKIKHKAVQTTLFAKYITSTTKVKKSVKGVVSKSIATYMTQIKTKSIPIIPKPIIAPKEKVIKEKVTKEKVTKEKVIKEKVIKEKTIKKKTIKKKTATCTPQEVVYMTSLNDHHDAQYDEDEQYDEQYAHYEQPKSEAEAEAEAKPKTEAEAEAEAKTEAKTDPIAPPPPPPLPRRVVRRRIQVRSQPL